MTPQSITNRIAGAGPNDTASKSTLLQFDRRYEHVAQPEKREAPPHDEPAGSSFMARLTLVLGLVGAGALVLFLLQNLQHTEIHFLWFDWTTRMLWALLASALIGAASALLAAFVLARRGRATSRPARAGQQR